MCAEDALELGDDVTDDLRHDGHATADDAACDFRITAKIELIKNLIMVQKGGTYDQSETDTISYVTSTSRASLKEAIVRRILVIHVLSKFQSINGDLIKKSSIERKALTKYLGQKLPPLRFFVMFAFAAWICRIRE